MGCHDRAHLRAAGIELKRRGVLSRDDHLRSAEPDGFAYPEREKGHEVWVQPRLDCSIDLPREPEPFSPAERTNTPWKSSASPSPELPIQVSQIAECHRTRQAQIDERQFMRIRAEEPDEMDPGEAGNVLAERLRDAVVPRPAPDHGLLCCKVVGSGLSKATSRSPM